MSIKCYIGFSELYLGREPAFMWINEHRQCGDLTFMDASFPEMYKSNSEYYDAMRDAIKECDVFLAFSCYSPDRPRGSYSSAIQLGKILERRVPIIIVRKTPKSIRVAGLSFDELMEKAPGRVRVFDTFDPEAGLAVEDLPDFIRSFAEGCGVGQDDFSFAGKHLEKPYEGDKPYVFISYSHLDRDKVYPVIAGLQKKGYRIWYDEGIHAASQWDEFIAGHIKDCGYMLAFISPNYIASNNCKDEINFARDLDKPRLLVCLEETKLPLGMAMRLRRLEAIDLYECRSVKAFFEKLEAAKGLSEMR